MSEVMHIVICGYPRAGTSLMQHMLTVALGPSFVNTMGDELRGVYTVGIDDKSRVTKRPLDVFHIDQIRRVNREAHKKLLRFILMVRDPHYVLTSHHEQGRTKYLISYDMGGEESAGLVASHKKVMQYRNEADCIVVKYEDLVRSISHIELQLRNFGMPFVFSMEDYMKVPQNHPGESKPLNRPVSTARKELTEEDKQRWNQQVEECPYLKEVCSDFGYAVNLTKEEVE